MKSSTILAIVGISVCMLVIGAAIDSAISSRASTVSTKTVTATSQNTIVEIVTRVSTLAPPPKIMINGTVDSEFFYPVDVNFCNRAKSISIVNATETLTGTVVTCGNYSAFVQNIAHITETFGGSNKTYNLYYGSYSIALPNNDTYISQVNLHDLSKTTSFDQSVGWLPLNYTVSAKISNYDIFCYYSNGSLNSPFQCAPDF